MMMCMVPRLPLSGLGVFSIETSLAEAMRSGYLLGCSDKTDDADILRNIIKDTFEEGDELPWPPTASYLQTVENPKLIELQCFLSTLISGNGSSVGSEKLETCFFHWARSLPCCNEWLVEVAEAHYGIYDTTTPIQKCPV